MNFNKLILLTIAACGLTGTLAQAKCCQHNQDRSRNSFADLITFPFKVVEFAVERVVLPVVQLPVKIANKVFDNNTQK